MATKEEILDAIAGMTVLELSELLSDFEEKFGVTAAAPVAVAAVAPAASGDADGGEEEQDSFDVVLTGAGDKKIQVIKEVRALTNLGLKDAKDLVDGAPGNVLEGASKEDAEKAKEALEAAGGTVTVVGGDLPGFKAIEAADADVKEAISAMEIAEDGSSRLNFFLQVYRAGDYPVYADYAVHRATEDLAGPRIVVVTK